MTDHNSIIRAFQRREAAEARAQRRLADALNGTAPSPQPFDMAEHTRLFDEAREARMAAALGGEVPEHLAAHVHLRETTAAAGLLLPGLRGRLERRTLELGDAHATDRTFADLVDRVERGPLGESETG